MKNNNSMFDKLKKGDSLEITYDSAVRKNDSKTLKVKSKSTVMKGKPGETEKITFENVSNPSGVNYYAYRKTSDGSVRYAVGDMSIWNVKFPEKLAEGGSFKTYIVEYEINGKRSVSEYLLLPSDRVENLLPTTAKIISVKEKPNSKDSKFDSGGNSEKDELNSKEQNAIKSIVLKGYYGSSGSLTKKQRIEVLQSLIAKGYLDKNADFTSKAVEYVRPKFDGGGTTQYAPVDEKISANEIRDFENYVHDVYADKGFTKAQVKSAVKKYLRDLNQQSTYGYGDSLDRERVYEYMKNPKLDKVTNPIFESGGDLGKENNEMLRNQVREVAHHSDEINEVVNKKTKVEPWVVAKMERASTDLSDVTHYLEGEKFAGGGGVGSIKVGDTVRARFEYDYTYNNYQPLQLSDWSGSEYEGKVLKIPNKTSIFYEIEFDGISEIITFPKSMAKYFIDKTNYAGGGNLSKIKFTSGELQRLSKEYYNLYLYNNGERVYSATLSTFEAAKVADKYNNIKMKYAEGGDLDTKDFSNLPLGTRINAYLERKDQDLKGRIIEITSNGYKIQTRQYDSYPVTYDMITRVMSFPPKPEAQPRKKFLGLFEDGGPVDYDSVDEEIRSLRSRIKSLEKINTNKSKEQIKDLTKQLAYLKGNYYHSTLSQGGSMYSGGGVGYVNQYFGKGYENDAIIELKKALPNHTFEKDKNSIIIDGGKFVIDTDSGRYGFIRAYSNEGSEGGISVQKLDEAISFIEGSNKYAGGGGVAYDLRPIGTKGKTESIEDSDSGEVFKGGGKIEPGMMAWRGNKSYMVVRFDDELQRWLLQSTTSGMQYLPKASELSEYEFIKLKSKGTKYAGGGDTDMPSDNEIRLMIKSFISKFPTDATSFRQSTDEIVDLAYNMQRILYEQEDKEWTSAANKPFLKAKYDMKPGERNAWYRNKINLALKKLNSSNLNEIYQYYKDWFNNEENTMFADGGDTDLQFKDKKYDITYTVRVSPDRSDRWEVVSNSPKWEEATIDTFVSEKDAVNHAQLVSGNKKESDPEERFMRNQFGGGGMNDDRVPFDPNVSLVSHPDFDKVGLETTEYTPLVMNIGRWVDISSNFKSDRKTGRGIKFLMPYRIIGVQKNYEGRTIYRGANQDDSFGTPINPEDIVRWLTEEEAKEMYSKNYDRYSDLGSGMYAPGGNVNSQDEMKQVFDLIYDKIYETNIPVDMTLDKSWVYDGITHFGSITIYTGYEKKGADAFGKVYSLVHSLGIDKTILNKYIIFSRVDGLGPKEDMDRYDKHRKINGGLSQWTNRQIYSDGGTMYSPGGNTGRQKNVLSEEMKLREYIKSAIRKNKINNFEVLVYEIFMQLNLKEEALKFIEGINSSEKTQVESIRIWTHIVTPEIQSQIRNVAKDIVEKGNNDTILIIKALETHFRFVSLYLIASQITRSTENIMMKNVNTPSGSTNENSDKITKLQKVVDSNLVPDTVKDKARKEIEKLQNQSFESSGSELIDEYDKDDSFVSDKQGEWNKEALAMVKKEKVQDMIGLVAEALQDANYHTQSFKFAKLIDSSIKTKEDWYRAEQFSGDDKTREVAIYIAKGSGWDSSILLPTLEFVLKMSGQHTLAKALQEAFVEDEGYYPNAIEVLTKRQSEYATDIATRTGLNQSGVADFIAKNGLTESETLNIIQGLGMNKISLADFMSAAIGNPNNEFEEKVVAFAKSNEAFKGKPSGPLKSETGETQEAIDLLMELSQDQKGKAKKETLEAIAFLKELL